MSLLTVSLLINGLILRVNSPALVKNEKKRFVLVQTLRTRMDVRALGAGRGGRRRLIGLETRSTTPSPEGGSGPRGEGLDSQSARVCLRLFLREMGRVCVELRACECP